MVQMSVDLFVREKAVQTFFHYYYKLFLVFEMLLTCYQYLQIIIIPYDELLISDYVSCKITVISDL